MSCRNNGKKGCSMPTPNRPNSYTIRPLPWRSMRQTPAGYIDAYGRHYQRGASGGLERRGFA
jgi:hypothetical protein